ncbi:MAG: putative flavoprotein (TIGR03862 family) [Paracoccaceae bacterium]|jgi:uncharacterized flavoprotein (TIGR03862 family)
MTDTLVIGSGPSGLMAAEMLADRGFSVTIAEAKPSAGRKLLMAGKSGLNLTKDEEFEPLLANYQEAAQWLRPMLAGFSNTDVCDWTKALGQEFFTGTSGRVFPSSMKSSPLLRAWLARLHSKGVQLQTRWKWIGIEGGVCVFDTPEGRQTQPAKATILALGGASWPKLGSDGAWAEILTTEGVNLTQFQPANVGFSVKWSPHMERFFGRPVKACALSAGTSVSRGEFIISSKGVEGGGIYSVSKSMRQGNELSIDLLPDVTAAEIAIKLAKPRGKNSLSNHLRKSLRLDPVRIALLQEFARPLSAEPETLAKQIKSVSVPHQGPRPISEAISTAGGVPQSAVNESLMLKAIPGVFCAGEMLDWEAPTGGYLLTACLATGRWAGTGAADYLG